MAGLQGQEAACFKPEQGMVFRLEGEDPFFTRTFSKAVGTARRGNRSFPFYNFYHYGVSSTMNEHRNMDLSLLEKQPCDPTS